MVNMFFTSNKVHTLYANAAYWADDLIYRGQESADQYASLLYYKHQMANENVKKKKNI